MNTSANTFTDLKNRTWELNLNFMLVKQVLNLTGINLAKPGRQVRTEEELKQLKEEDYPVYLKLNNDPVIMIDVIYALVKKQADEAGVTDVEFGESIGPKQFNAASEVFWRVYQNFFEEMGDQMGAQMVQAVMKLRKAMNLHGAKIEDYVDRELGSLEEKIDRELMNAAKTT